MGWGKKLSAIIATFSVGNIDWWKKGINDVFEMFKWCTVFEISCLGYGKLYRIFYDKNSYLIWANSKCSKTA